MLFSSTIPQVSDYVRQYTPPIQPTKPSYGGSQVLGDLLAAGQIGAGIGLMATGAGAGVGIPLIAGGASTAYNTNKQFLREGTGFHGLPAGSHESGNDLTLVHSKTGQPTGIKMEGKEILVGSENSEALRNAVAKKDKKAVYAIMLAQLNEKPKKYDGEVKLWDGTKGWNGLSSTFSNSNPSADESSWINQMQGYGTIPYAGTNDTNYLAPTPQGNNYNFADTSWAAGMPYAPKATPMYSPNYVTPQTQTPFSFANPNSTYNPSAPNYANNNITNYSYPDTTNTANATTPTDTPNKWGYLATALPGALQTIYGLSQMHQTLPTFTEPQSYKNYIGQLQQMSTQGFSPEENALYNRDIQGTYGIGLNNLKNNSGGNSAAVLGGLNNLGNAMNEAKLKGAAEDKQMQRQNLLNYGQGLTQEAQLYNLPQQEWLMKNYLAKQQMANQFVDSGLGNLEGSYLNYLHATDPNRIKYNTEVNRIYQ